MPTDPYPADRLVVGSVGGAGPVPSPDRAQAARTTMATLSATPDVFETFFDQAQIGLALADLSTRYVRVNATYAELVGRSPEDLIGLPFSALLHPDERRDEVDALLHGREQSLQTEQRYLAPDGCARWVLHGLAIVPTAEGRPGWFAVSAQDITERRRAEQDLRNLTDVLAERAVRDPLTGLANRGLLEERLRAVLARDGRTGDTTGLLFLDLDGFKAVNDKHGHLIGDAVLRTVAGRLRTAVRPSDTVARLGGDEFVVLVESAAPEAMAGLVRRLRQEISAPIAVNDLDLKVGVSVGSALSEAGVSEPSALLGRADREMYADKQRRGRPSLRPCPTRRAPG